MKIESLISNIGAASIVALFLVGCSDYDNGFTEKEIAFQEAFRKQFGEIDPEQDWNLATRAMLHVNFNEDTNVKVYSAAPYSPASVLMANYNVSSPSDLGFDMPEGTEEVYVQAISGKKMLISGYYKVINGVVEGLGQTRAGEDITLNVEKGDVKAYKVYDFTDADGNPHSRDYQLQMLTGIPKSPTDIKSPGTWKISEMRPILGKGGVFAEEQHNWKRYVQSGILEKDVMYTIKEGGGEISVTLEYFCTSTTDNNFAYFYWEGDNLPTVENVKLYCLIENVTDPKNDYVQHNAWGGFTSNQIGNDIIEAWKDERQYDDAEVRGTTFQLVYFDEAGNASLTFPEGIHIGFAVTLGRYNPEKDLGATNTDHVWFSLEDMNVSSKNWGSTYGELYNDQNFPAAATFRVGEKVCLGFEDYPEDKGADLNDIMFWVQGDFIEEIPKLITDTDKEQSWILAYEDLGNSFDWDYNDIVLKVSHVSGDPDITITPLAAGGTLASYVKFYGKEIGEIHQLMGAAPAPSGGYTPINADAKGNAGNSITCNIAEFYPDNVVDDGNEDDDGDNKTDAVEGLEQAYSMTVFGDVDKMGGITLHVQPADGTDGEETVIAYTGPGTAPEVICLPGTWTRTAEEGDEIVTYECEWRWPAEYRNIDKAYNNNESNFATWAANYRKSRDWYKRNPDRNLCVSGTFERVLFKTEKETPPTLYDKGYKVSEIKGVTTDEEVWDCKAYWIPPSSLLEGAKSIEISYVSEDSYKVFLADILKYTYNDGFTGTSHFVPEEQIENFVTNGFFICFNAGFGKVEVYIKIIK